MPKYQQFKLYVAGVNPRSERIIAQVIKLFDGSFGVNYHLNVIDVVDNPQQAEDDHILATPTLVRISPLPRRFIIGDLSHTEKVREALDLMEVDPIQKRTEQ